MQNQSDERDFFVDTLDKDVFDGGDGQDGVTYGHRADPVHVTLSGSENSTVSIGGVAEDTLRNIEDVIGGTGDDLVTGSDEDNTLWGMGGDDRLYGQNGIDELKGGAGRDYLDGGEGSDWALYKDKFVPIRVTLAGSEEATVYVNGVAEDTLRNIECLQGGFDDDVLIGDDQDNILIGEMGADTLTGGGGTDIFAYDSVSDGGDTIQDFRADQGDKIALSDFLIFAQGNPELSFSGTNPEPYSVWYEPMQNGEGITVKVDANSDSRTEEFSITLNGVTSLRESDFILG